MTPTKTTEKPKRKINRRSSEQIVADLEAEIERVKARAAAKQVKQTEHGKALLTAVRTIDKATKIAVNAKARETVNALESARAILSDHLSGMGVKPPARHGKLLGKQSGTARSSEGEVSQ